MLITAHTKGFSKLKSDLSVEGRRQKKALQLAIKVEAFRQLRVLRDEIKKGIPGGHPYAAQLSEIASRTKTGRLKKNQIPLSRLARLVRYDVVYVGGELQMIFGFTGGRLSESWKNLLIRHEEGANVLYRKSRTQLGIDLANIGGRLKKKGDPDAKYFFLKKSTGRRIGIPKRGMIDPFWRRHEAEARINISANFRKKMRGQRI